MQRWTVMDRQSREIYLTQERWEHILSKHPELRGRLEDVLLTIRMGRRKQSKLDPQTFCYYRTIRHDYDLRSLSLSHFAGTKRYRCQ